MGFCMIFGLSKKAQAARAAALAARADKREKIGFYSTFGRSSGRDLPLERNRAARAAKVGARAAIPVSAYTG